MNKEKLCESEILENENALLDKNNSPKSIIKLFLTKVKYFFKEVKELANKLNSAKKEGKKFILSFDDIIELIKYSIVNLQNIINININDKEIIHEMVKDYIKNLNYNVISFENGGLGDINFKLKKIKEKNINQRIDNFINKTNILTGFQSLSNDTITRLSSKSYLKESYKNFRKRNKLAENEKDKENIYQNDEKDIQKKIFVNYNQQTEISKNKSKNIFIIGNESNLTNRKKNTSRSEKKVKYRNSKLFQNIEKKTETKNNIQNNNFTPKEDKYNMRCSSVPFSKNNKKKITINNFNSFNGYILTYNDYENNLFTNHTNKNGITIKGKISIFNNVPKPSQLANQLLEKSKKFINEYNGFSAREKRKKKKNK